MRQPLQDFGQQYQIAVLTPTVLSAAVDLTQVHRLRGYDAVHLAMALTVHRGHAATGLPFTFLSADDDLLAAAQAEGLLVGNPNHHP